MKKCFILCHIILYCIYCILSFLLFVASPVLYVIIQYIRR